MVENSRDSSCPLERRHFSIKTKADLVVMDLWIPTSTLSSAMVVVCCRVDADPGKGWPLYAHLGKGWPLYVQIYVSVHLSDL